MKVENPQLLGFFLKQNYVTFRNCLPDFWFDYYSQTKTEPIKQYQSDFFARQNQTNKMSGKTMFECYTPSAKRQS